jgi:predicted aspartyl protease
MSFLAPKQPSNNYAQQQMAEMRRQNDVQAAEIEAEKQKIEEASAAQEEGRSKVISGGSGLRGLLSFVDESTGKVAARLKKKLGA